MTQKVYFVNKDYIHFPLDKIKTEDIGTFHKNTTKKGTIFRF